METLFGAVQGMDGRSVWRLWLELFRGWMVGQCGGIGWSCSGDGLYVGVEALVGAVQGMDGRSVWRLWLVLFRGWMVNQLKHWLVLFRMIEIKSIENDTCSYEKGNILIQFIFLNQIPIIVSIYNNDIVMLLKYLFLEVMPKKASGI